jgi:hypothetical protein
MDRIISGTPVTPKERVAAAMNLRPVDRVPFMCQMSIGHMLLQLKVSPAEFWFDPRVFADGLLRLREFYGFDGILVSLHGHDPDWRSSVTSIRTTEEGEEVLWKNGDRTLCVYDDLPRFIQHTRVAPPAFAELSPEELPSTLEYIPVSSGLHFALHQNHMFDVLVDLVDRAGHEYSVHGEVTSPFDYFLDLCGYQEGLMALVVDPGKCRQILGHFARLVQELAESMCATGVDAIKVSSPFAGSGFISPDFYATFVLPYEGQIVQAVRARGTPIYLHTCGAIGDRLDLMLQSGASGLECLDPPPLGNVELEDAFNLLGGKAFIKGNIDSVNTLLRGTRQAIVADARERVRMGKAAGGFILSTACSIAPAVPAEHIVLLKDVVEQWGRSEKQG